MMCDPKQQQQQRQHYLDLKKLISPGTRADLVEASLKLLLSMSADDEFLSILSQEECKDLICLFCDILHNEPSNRSLLFSILVNLTASRHVNEISSYLAASTKIINDCLDQCICQPNLNERICAVRAAQLLSNLTRHFPQQLANKFMITPEFLSKLMGEFASRIDKETTDADENVGTYLGFMLMNLATIPAIGAQLASADHLPRLSSMLSPSVGRKKRMAALETIFNLSLQDELHPLLLANDSARDPLLSALLGPLADAEDELDEEETAKLPPALQYWEGQREMDPELWGRLLSTLYQLCATRLGRETLRQKGVYALLRQLDRARQRMDGGKSGAMGSLMGASGQMVLLDAGHEQGELDVLRALIGILVRAEEDMGLPGQSEMADSIRQLGMKHP